MLDGTKDEKIIPGIILPDALCEVDVCGTYCGMQIYAPVGDHTASVYGSELNMLANECKKIRKMF